MGVVLAVAMAGGKTDVLLTAGTTTTGGMLLLGVGVDTLDVVELDGVEAAAAAGWVEATGGVVLVGEATEEEEEVE